MSADVFVDTNVFLYAIADSTEKRVRDSAAWSRAGNVLRDGLKWRCGVQCRSIGSQWSV